MSPMRTPVHIIPWTQDGIQALARMLAAKPALLAETRLVFPHNRPIRHLRAALAAQPGLPRPLVLPRMQALDEFLRRLRQDLEPAPLVRAGLLDRIGLLQGIVRDLALHDGPLKNLADSASLFFPWGARLAALLDEFARHGVTAQSIQHVSGEVLPWAEALLGQLDAIAARFGEAMRERNWTTPGLDAQWLSQNLDQAAAHLAGERLVFAGFYALSPTEETLLHRLWQQGQALVVWHTDPALADGGEPAWAAREHARILRRWKSRAVLLAGPDNQPDNQTYGQPGSQRQSPRVRRFYEGFDLHSQLFALERELAALPDSESTAIVLPDPGALVPVMHHLPDVDVNISMGYPLARSSLAHLVESVLRLHENADASGRFAWRDLLALARQPLLRMLKAGEDAPLKSAYPAWERHIRASSAFQSAWEWPLAYDAEACAAAEEEVRALHAEVLEACVTRFAGLTTLRQTGAAVANLCELLRRRGGDLWQRLLIDAECLLRLWQSVAPELMGSILADEPQKQSLLFLILRHLLDTERVSFEPEPLAGLQVLGMLETRLLTFRRVFVLDATEEHLPGASAPDPLLPDSLRQELGLPGPRERDNVAAHNFYRLLLGADQVTVLYQAGVRPGALEGKSVRSRYVEQLLWELERRERRLVKPAPMPSARTEASAPLLAVNFPMTAILTRRAAIAASPGVCQRLLERLRGKGIAATAIENWLTCPKQAFYRRVLGLRPIQQVAEDGDRALLGSIVHSVLKDFLGQHLHRPIRAASLDASALCAAFDQAFAGSAFARQMPYEGRSALAAVARERLTRFVQNLPETIVAGLELEAETVVPVLDFAVRLFGAVDRVDLRSGGHEPEGHVVLDYKTGRVKEDGLEAWLDADLFARLAACTPGSPEAAALLAELGDSGLDVQLPVYLHLLGRGREFQPVNAAWVELAKSGEERPFFTKDQGAAERSLVVQERVPALVRFVLEHLLTAPELPARPGRHCDWCDFQGPCGS